MDDSMLEVFVFESHRMLCHLEQLIIQSERMGAYSSSAISEIFRIMHTIKGSAAMLAFKDIETLAHSIEDIFFYIRENDPQNIDYTELNNFILEGIDFIKKELDEIDSNGQPVGDSKHIVRQMQEFLKHIKTNGSNIIEKRDGKSANDYELEEYGNALSGDKYIYKTKILFKEDCQMENIRAYSIVHSLKEFCSTYYHLPRELLEDDNNATIIREEGFCVSFKTDYTFEQVEKFFMQIPLVKEFKLTEIDESEYDLFIKAGAKIQGSKIGYSEFCPQKDDANQKSSHQSMISVNVSKLDKLMDLMGELVTSEAMVVQNPDLQGLKLNNFENAARQLNKVTSEIQDTVMSIRMIPLSNTFLRMHRIIRDMGQKLEKEVNLEIIGEDTEVDKNIIERLSDPLMHLVRNAIDHGIETPVERVNKGKPSAGRIVLEAKNSGSDVLVIVKDDGRGLDREKILSRARNNNLIKIAEDGLSDREVYNLILLPGFSTTENVTEFSGRGVGMDIVARNIEAVGGSILVDSQLDKGTTVTLKIPLTLAIINGIILKVGSGLYIIPTISIKEIFRPSEQDLLEDTDGNEMIMVRGECYPIFRLHREFKIDNAIDNFSEGIFIMVEEDDKTFCIFADELVGEQQIVIKSLPNYIKKVKRIKGLSGCTLLGDGSIGLILDVARLI